MKLLLIPFVSILTTSAVNAACPSISEEFLNCTIRGGKKVLSVCAQSDTVSYLFGPAKGLPELALTQSARNVDYEPWPGIGRSIWETVTFKNKDVSYTVYGSIDKMLAVDEANPEAVFGGVEVVQNGKTLAQLECDKGSVRFTYGTALMDAKTAAGQCWKADKRLWTDC